MNKMDNEILLSRAVQQNFLWSDKPFAMGQAWIDLLMLAEWKDKDVISKGTIVHLERGQVGRAILWLAERWGWDRKRVKRFLKILETQKMATTESTTRGTIITIENYDKYQLSGTTDGTNDGTTYGQPMDNDGTHPKKEKKEKKEKNIKEIKPKPLRNKIPPTVDMVREYCESRNNGIDAEVFCDFYQSKDWMIGKDKMKDWQASVRTWEKKHGTNISAKNTKSERPSSDVTERERASIKDWVARKRLQEL